MGGRISTVLTLGIFIFMAARLAHSEPANGAGEALKQARPQTLSIQGKAWNVDTGTPITSAVLVANAERDATQYRSVVDLEGAYAIGALPVSATGDLSATNYLLEVHAPGYRFRDESDPGNELANPPIVTTGSFNPVTGVATVDLPMVPVTSDVVIAGIIFDEETDVPLGGAVFSLIVLDVDSGTTDTVGVVYTGADGRFEMRDVIDRVSKGIDPETPIRCLFEAETYDEFIIDLAAIPGAGIDGQFSLTKIFVPGSIVGLVSDLATGLPVADARVTAQGSQGVLGFTVDTNNDGVYVILNLNSDEYTVRVSATTHPGQSQLKTASVSGGAASLNFQLGDDAEGDGEGQSEGEGDGFGCAAVRGNGSRNRGLNGDLMFVSVLMGTFLVTRRQTSRIGQRNYPGSAK